MKTKPEKKFRLLDLFSGAGGACKGYQRAGFYVVGVDIKPQPHYCGEEFHQADALEFCREHGREFDVIHASPPCQGYTLMRGLGGKAVGRKTPRLIPEVRCLLSATAKVYVIENVQGAPLIDPMKLCGSMFGLGVRRHRLFETSIPLSCDLKCNHRGPWPIAVWGDGRPSRQEARKRFQGPIAVYGDHPEDSPIHRRGYSKPHLTRRAATLKVGQEAMGIDWMTWKELTQAIPPAYCEWIGRQLLNCLHACDE